MRNQIEQFLYQEGFKPLKVRTRILAEYVYCLGESRHPLKNDILDIIAERFNIKKQAVAQHLYQAKKYYCQVKGIPNKTMSATQLAYDLYVKFINRG